MSSPTTAAPAPESDAIGESTVQALRRRAWLIAVCVLVTGGFALIVSVLKEKQYTAQASLLFRDPGLGPDSQGLFEIGDPDRQAATNIALVSLQVVADLTAEDLDDDLDGDAVAQQVAIKTDQQSDVVNIRATDSSPERAAELANTFALNYIGFRRNADRSRIRQARRLVARDLEELLPSERAGPAGQSLRREIGRLQALGAIQTGNAELVQTASVPESASSPKVKQNMVLGAVVGLVLGIGLALLAELLDRRLRSARDFESALGGLPVLGRFRDLEICAPAATALANC